MLISHSLKVLARWALYPCGNKIHKENSLALILNTKQEQMTARDMQAAES